MTHDYIDATISDCYSYFISSNDAANKGWFMYTVIIDGCEQESLRSARAALKAAKKYAQDEQNVFVAFFRKADGQKGFLNPNGDHSIVGQKH